MDFFYDGQIRRYVTQFMRIFIGFKFQSNDGSLKQVPVMYGDLTKQVAQIIKENSENKMSSVPKISCYITGLELDRSRLADASFVSKVSVRGRSYESFDDVTGEPIYDNTQGGGYTVERLMPTPFKLSMRADIWTSNTDQKLQLLEQILVLFNPSLEVQTTDNYIDWTSLSVVELTASNFSSRSIPQGTETDIDICTLDFELPIYISPPVKVKKLGVVQKIIMNMFDDDGQLKPLSELAFNSPLDNTDVRTTSIVTTPGNFGVLMLSSKTVTGVETGSYYVSALDPNEAIVESGLDIPKKTGAVIDWNKIIPQYGKYRPGISRIRFLQPNGYELIGTFSVNEVDSQFLVVDFDTDSEPQTDLIINAIINPQTFNPLATRVAGIKYLILEDIGSTNNTDGADAWKNANASDFVAAANSIIEWSGTQWTVIFDPASQTITPYYIKNLKTGVQYKWENNQWLKSFEGEYTAGYWSFDLEG
jgi:hypothetical protein